MLKYSYIVDIGLGAFRAAKFNPNSNVGQELFCKCGGRYKYSQKVFRDLLLTDATLYQSDYDLESVACPYCGEVYNIKNKVRLLEPNFGALVEVNFYLKKQTLSNGNKILRLVKERVYAYYSESSSNNLNEIMIYDELNFNYDTNEVNVFIDNSLFIESNNKTLMQTAKDEQLNNVDNFFEKNISYEINFGTLSQIKKFFTFNNNGIIYNNLNDCFLFLKEIGDRLIDFEKIKHSPHTYISSFWENNKIYTESVIEDNVKKVKKFIYVEDEFSFSDEKVKQEFNPGPYILSLNHLAFAVLSIHSYSSVITIFTTKGYKFFESFIKSDIIANPNVFTHHGATYPSKIIEICANYNRFGQKRNQTNYVDKNNETLDMTVYLKFSNILYNKVYLIEDILKLKAFAERNYITKLQLEQLFNKYPEDQVYTVIGFLGKSDKIDLITFKHIEHIIRYKLYEKSSDFLNIYQDTIKTLKNITRTQPAVVKHMNNHKLSQKEKDSLSVYLAVKENQIFEIKNWKDLIKYHDNLSILFNVFQDATKVEAYAMSIEKRQFLDDEIDFYQFEVIPSAFELQREHKVMSHCINTYIDSIIRETYLAVRVVDKISNEHSTLGLRINGKEIKFDQLKSYSNSRSSPYLIDAVLKFFTKHKIDFKGGTTFDLSKDGSRSMIDSRKDVLPLNKSQEFRLRLLAKMKKQLDNKEEINKEEYNKLIEEFHQLFIDNNN